MSDAKPLLCDMCGMAVERDHLLSIDGKTLHFCCEGCKSMYEMLHDLKKAGNGPKKEKE